MFVRAKGREPYRCLQIVENHREGARIRQWVLCTLGRMDELMASGQTDVLLHSLGRFANQVRVTEGYERGQLEAGVAPHHGGCIVAAWGRAAAGGSRCHGWATLMPTLRRREDGAAPEGLSSGWGLYA